MSKAKKHKCTCDVCHKHFRSKNKFKKLCPEHSSVGKVPEELDVTPPLIDAFDEIEPYVPLDEEDDNMLDKY